MFYIFHFYLTWDLDSNFNFQQLCKKNTNWVRSPFEIVSWVQLIVWMDWHNSSWLKNKSLRKKRKNINKLRFWFMIHVCLKNLCFPFLCLMPLSTLALIAEHNNSVFNSVTFLILIAVRNSVEIRMVTFNVFVQKLNKTTSISLLFIEISPFV